MMLAMEEARKAYKEGEVPIGAVLVGGDGDLICREHNRMEQLGDATAHAELLCLRGRRRLMESTLYVTMEPCAMCAGAIVLSRVKRLVYGAADSKFGGVESLFNIVGKGNWEVEVRAGLMEAESRELLKKFFTERKAQR